MAPVTGPVRVAVAGLGSVAQAVHLPLLARRGDLFEVAAVAELSPSIRDTVGERYGVPKERPWLLVPRQSRRNLVPRVQVASTADPSRRTRLVTAADETIPAV